MTEKRGPALLIVARPNKGVIHPEDYLKAAGELLFLLFAVVWGVTYVWNPGVIEQNPLRDRLGYNNLCVGFDAAPATYIGLLLFLPTVYFCIRYAWTDMERTQLLRARLTSLQYYFSVSTDALYVVSICVFGLVFVISPFDSIWLHSLAFLQYIAIRFLVVWANIYEHAAPPKSSIRFLWVYGFVSLAFPALVITNYLTYEAPPFGGDPASPLVPYQLSMIFDYTWFLCLALTTKFMPRAEGMRIGTSIIEEASA